MRDLAARGAKTATPDEQKILVRYVGWGGLPQAFDFGNEKWSKEYRELKSLLSADDFAAARSTVQNAHFTSETVIRGIYQGLARLGLNGGTPLILEPSAGIGNFIGLCPEYLTPRFEAVECDPTTAAICKFLYPNVKHHQSKLEKADLKGEHFDVAIGNPPFGDESVYERTFPLKASIHNYFLAKSISLLREGGVAAFVVSRRFLDKGDSSAREYIAEYADFLGAVRLPNIAFKQNALTEVSTDIVFFQKSRKEKTRNPDWTQTGRIEVENRKQGGTATTDINLYFLAHPEQIIGRMALTGGAHENDINCVADPGLDLEREIASRLDMLPEVYVRRESDPALTETEKTDRDFIGSDYFRSLKRDSLCIEPSGKIAVKFANDFGRDTYRLHTVKGNTDRMRLTGMIRIRDTLRELLNAEKSDADTDLIEGVRRRLNTEYDSFVKKFGHLSSPKNKSLLAVDPQCQLVASLEFEFDKGLSADTARKLNRKPRPASAKKAAILLKRVLHPTVMASHAETVQDALLISLRETGRVDFARMNQLLGRPVEDIQKELRQAGLIFLNPASEEWEIRDKYLTGNVRQKLRVARDAAKTNESFQANVEALAEAMPSEIEAVDIGIRFGASWVPGEVFTDFINERISDRGSQEIRYIPVLGRWDAKIRIYDASADTDVWGIPEYPAAKILESLLTSRPIKVEKETGEEDERGKPVKVVDQELTAAAMAKADEIRQAFLDWVWEDDARREKLTTLYNERFNTHVPPGYDGSSLELVNASSEITLRPHQKDVVWRSIQEGTALFDHVVGAGKSLACVATVMESKRMGFMNKPMIVVPNHLLYQWKDFFYSLYPDAHILVAEKNDFVKKNRERFFARVATGDWDAVIVAHSSFRKIDMPHDAQKEILEEQIGMVVDAIQEGKTNRGSRATIKQLEKQRDRMRARFDALLASTGPKDRSVDFADLGVDALFVDESQEFKNLAYTTSMNVAGLGNITGSAKAFDLFIKCRYLQQKNNGRGVFFMTGTPISNTIAEVYTLQRYLQYDELRAIGVEHFDAWASTFGQVTSGWELDATGVNYKLKSRFASFQNVPELLSMYRSFADVVTRNDLDEHARQAGQRPLTPPVLDGKPYNHVVDRSESQACYMDSIIHRMEHLPHDPRKDNPLKITNDARKAGLDYRLIDPEAGDYPGSKVNAAVDRIYDIWKDTSDDKGTQLVFCDLSTPKGTFRANDQAAPEFEPETEAAAADDALRRDSAAFAAEVEKVRATGVAPQNPAVMLKQTPLVLKLIGKDLLTGKEAGNNGIFVSPHTFRNILDGMHTVTLDMLKQVPESISDPVMIFDSASQRNQGDVVFMLELTDANGATLVVPVALQAKAKGVEFDIIKSIYAKEDYGIPNNEWFKREAENRTRYVNWEKTERWQRRTGVQFPVGSLTNASGNTIYTETDFVKLRQEQSSDEFDFNDDSFVPDADLIEEGDENGEDATTARDMDDLVSFAANFSVYDDVKRKLIARGIPDDEIAFIHDANTDIRKAKLFSDMQAGRVRILMGSTSKMGAGMNVQKRLVAAHHLDAPWRPSDLEQRNGRIIRQGNVFYERDPDNFSVGIYNYATKRTYDARMWQTIEYKAAAIEQFRKGDLLQRVIDDVRSEAANAAEMKAAASGNPLILTQVKLASDLRKLEALYAQHQRSQHRLRDRLRWLDSARERLANAEAAYVENRKRRDAHTHTVFEKGKERICTEILISGQILREKDSEKIKEALRGCVNAVMKSQTQKPLFGIYRGFDIHVHRSGDGFRFGLKGSGEHEFLPDNLFYSLDDKFSMSGFFQRLDNFFDKGMEQAFQTYKGNVDRELAELETVKAALGQDFPQKDELILTRENHTAVMRELKRMQDEPGYVSAWEPKTEYLLPEPEGAGGEPQKPAVNGFLEYLKEDEPDARYSYNTTEIEGGYKLVRFMKHPHVGSLGGAYYNDGQWHAVTDAPKGSSPVAFKTVEEALDFARSDARKRGLVLDESGRKPPEKIGEVADSEKERLWSRFEITGDFRTAVHAAQNTKRDDDVLPERQTQAAHVTQQFADAGFVPIYSGHGPMRVYTKCPQKTADGGEVFIRINATERGTFTVRSQYEKNNIIDARRSHTVTADSVDEALAVVANFEKYLLPDTARVAEQAAVEPKRTPQDERNTLLEPVAPDDALPVSEVQAKAIKSLMHGAEGQFFKEKMREMQRIFDAMPHTYGQDGKGDGAIAYLHYFMGGCDWYITERDKSPGQHQAFGFACLGDPYNVELGYISLPEITACGAELDLHFNPLTIGEIKRDLGIDAPTNPPVPDYRPEWPVCGFTELAELAEKALPRDRWKDSVREAWRKPFLERIAADDENPETVIECLRLARHDASPEGQAELKAMRMKLDESMKGMDVSGLQKMELLRTTMDRIRVAPDRQKALESAVNEFGKNVRQSGMNR